MRSPRSPILFAPHTEVWSSWIHAIHKATLYPSCSLIIDDKPLSFSTRGLVWCYNAQRRYIRAILWSLMTRLCSSTRGLAWCYNTRRCYIKALLWSSATRLCFATKALIYASWHATLSFHTISSIIYQYITPKYNPEGRNQHQIVSEKSEVRE